MSKIIGDPKLEKWAREQPPGNTSVYINWDAINSMPEEYEPVLARVAYDPAKLEETFANVGSRSTPSWYPNTDFLYEIAEARGVIGSDVSLSERLIDEVDINPMMMKPIDAAPNFQKRHIGHKISKRSYVIQEDGEPRYSSVCTSEYDAWTRCIEDWSKEEKYTENYTKPGKYDYKYDTPHKRQAHFLSELKFASAKAETKAHCKTIRELAGLPTGYTTAQLKSGIMVFVRIQRSQAVLKMETAANVEAIRNGGRLGHRATAALFGGETQQIEALQHDDIPAEVVEPQSDDAILSDFGSDIPKQTSPYDGQPDHVRARMALEEYSGSGAVNSETSTLVTQMIGWLERNGERSLQDARWAQVLATIRQIEESVADGEYVDHGLKLS